MAKNSSVSLGDHFETFVDERVKAGRYASASDAVRAGLRLLEQEETRLEALRAALVKGEESALPRTSILKQFSASLMKNNAL